MMRLNDVTFPEPRNLFASEKECHDAMLAEITAVSRALQRMDVKPVSFDRFYRDTRRLWLKVWRHYC